MPVADNEDRAFSDAVWDSLKNRLVATFGGVTAYQRAPALGVWAPARDRRTAEDIFVVEVMAATFDAQWWQSLQAQLERDLRQQEIVVRAIRITELRPARRENQS